MPVSRTVKLTPGQRAGKRTGRPGTPRRRFLIPGITRPGAVTLTARWWPCPARPSPQAPGTA